MSDVSCPDDSAVVVIGNFDEQFSLRSRLTRATDRMSMVADLTDHLAEDFELCTQLGANPALMAERLIALSAVIYSMDVRRHLVRQGEEHADE